MAQRIRGSVLDPGEQWRRSWLRGPGDGLSRENRGIWETAWADDGEQAQCTSGLQGGLERGERKRAIGAECEGKVNEAWRSGEPHREWRTPASTTPPP
ncbi:hypothetical protein NDU88_008017 [Pleurodeles waltl]|uniref:Uncharacterized protein n=1 Tax=Pleurodeles waltl TaxID=8319 RepID=A0AAV7NUY7_PLEWA|nr:hypothetical protein NDU88_008017 [Pleurodeles waltl]